MISSSDLYQTHLQLHPQLPCSERVAREFLEINPVIADCCNLNFVANMFADWVGSQSKFEEGCEEEW